MSTDSAKQGTLFDFEDVERPQIYEKYPIHHPDDSEVVLGWMADVNREGEAFVAQRTRFSGSAVKEEQDYYRKVGGYSMVTPFLTWLHHHGVRTIFIEEVDNERVIEYSLSHFQDGEDVEDVHGHPQKCLPVDKARHKWPRDTATVAGGSR